MTIVGVAAVAVVSVGTLSTAANAEPPGPCYGSTKTVIIEKHEADYGASAVVQNCTGPGHRYTVDFKNAPDPDCVSIGYGKTHKFQGVNILPLGVTVRGIKECL